ncbi:MAG: metallophosphoesterase family protein [Saprospiraceae bacterium]
MKIAILSDIHGNHYALLQVLQKAKQIKVEKILILGDLIGYYYYPEKVLEILFEWDCKFIKGNHEDLLKEILNGSIKIEMVTEKHGSGHCMALERLNSAQIAELVSLPEQLQLEVDNINILMCHGSPWDPNMYLYPDTQKSTLNRACSSGTDIVLIGHSHYQFAYSYLGTTLINPGSVGQSRQTGGLADWAVLDTENGAIQLLSTPYDTSELIKEVFRIDPSNVYLRDVLVRNRQ